MPQQMAYQHTALDRVLGGDHEVLLPSATCIVGGRVDARASRQSALISLTELGKLCAGHRAPVVYLNA